MPVANVDIHFTKDRGGVLGFDKDSTHSTSQSNIWYTSGWDYNFSNRSVTKVVMNLQVCLRGKYSGTLTRSFTAAAQYNGMYVTLGTFSGTRNCTGYAGDNKWPWTNFAIPSWGTDYLVINITDSNVINFLKNYGSSAQYSLSSNDNSYFYQQIDLIIDQYEYSDPPKIEKFIYPVAGKITYNTSPRIAVQGSTSSGSITNYRYSYNNSNWTNTGKTGTSAAFQTSAQSTGAKTIYVQAYNGSEWSSSAQQNFTIGTTSLGATEGALIDDVYIDNAQTYISNLAAYYGNTAPAWTTCNAGTKLNASQISELNTRLQNLTPRQSFTVPSVGDKVDNSLFSITINNAIKNS